MAPGQDQSYIQPYAVRRLLTQGAVSAGSRLGAFVGIATFYLAVATLTTTGFGDITLTGTDHRLLAIV